MYIRQHSLTTVQKAPQIKAETIEKIVEKTNSKIEQAIIKYFELSGPENSKPNPSILRKLMRYVE